MYVDNSTQMQSYTQQMRAQKPSTEEIFSKIMQEVDADGDGTISSEELSALEGKKQSMLAQADGDGDGSISEDELLTSIQEHEASRRQKAPESDQMQGMPSISDIISKIMQDADSDGDGSISAKELAKLDPKFQEKLLEADGDDDGIITEEELSNQISEDMEQKQMMPPPMMSNMQDMSMNNFKDLLTSLFENDESQSDTATQLQNYLSKLGLGESQIDDFMNLLENSRFEVRA
jgi:Ca2+-binding EF-hand superfamily protein